MYRCLTGPVVDPAVANTPAWRRADIGAANGHSNARGVLDVMRTISLGGEAGGVRLLSPPTIERIFDVQADGVDLVLGVPLRFGLGFSIRGRMASWGGSGGSMVTMDVDRGVTVSYAMNRMAPPTVGSARGQEYFFAVYSALA
jgi:hypothetical protein